MMAAKENQRCFNCGELGHFLNNCPVRATIQDRHRHPKWPQQQLSYQQRSGNSQESAGWPCTSTANRKPFRPTLPTISEQENQIPAHIQTTSHTEQFRWEPAASW